jgi:hypothetical protein
VGHGPLSHSLERLFKHEFAIDHHIATALVITGDNADSEIRRILQSFGVNADAVIDMIANRQSPWAPFFLGPFNVDTLDAITRSMTYLQRNSLNTPPYAVLLAALSNGDEAQMALDAFWRQKDFVYTNLIFGPMGILADRNAQDYMRKHLGDFRREHFFLTETELRRVHPRVFSGIDQPRWDRVTVHRRRFDVDLSIADRSCRYTERKESITVDFAHRPKDLGLPEPSTTRIESHDGEVPGD